MRLTKFIKEKLAFPLTFGVTEQAEKFRNKLVLTSLKVVSVTDAKSQNLAVDVARDIRSWVADVEKKRVELTKPLLTAQRKIKALADDHCAPLIQEIARLEKLTDIFQAQEQKRVEDETRRQQEAIRVAELDRLAKATQAMLAQQEADRAAAEAKNKAQRIEAQRSADAAKAQQESAAEAVRASRALIVAPLPEVTKTAGLAVTNNVKRVITDKDALFKAHPEFFSVEPRLSIINDRCFPNDLKASKDNPDTTSIPGLTMFYATESVVRKW